MKVSVVITKRAILSALAGLLMMPVNAQTFAEWFEQSNTRLKYSAAQVVSLQGYLGQLENGFQIASSGLGNIGNLKNDEFTMHTTYYSSLGTVNPALAAMSEVTEITTLQLEIAGRLETAVARYRTDGLLSGDQLALMARLLNTIIREGIQELTALAELLTNDRLELSDDQRASRVLAIHASTKERYAFTLWLTDKVDLFEQQKNADLQWLGAVKGLYGIQ